MAEEAMKLTQALSTCLFLYLPIFESDTIIPIERKLKGRQRMDDKQLIAALQEAPVFDLYKLFQQYGQNRSLYVLLEKLVDLKEQHYLKT